MGVGSDMFIREIAALVAAFIGIPANTESLSEVSSTVGLPGAGDVPLPVVLPIEELTRRRELKHGRQYTGLPWVGRKGRVVETPQSSQTAWCRLGLATRTWAGEDRYII